MWRIKSGGIARLAFIFGSSLAANYVLVFLLTLIHLYSMPVMLGIIILEVAALLWLHRKSLTRSLEDYSYSIKNWIQSLKADHFKELIPTSFLKVVEYLVFLLLMVLALSDIFWFIQRFTNNLSGVFQTWDAVVSWNHWAVEWAAGKFPTATSYYPQLIPTNWSISYVLMHGLELQSFAKLIMPLFCLLMILMLFDLGIRNRSFGFFLGVILTKMIIKNFTGDYISDGYADLPAAFFGFCSIYFLILGSQKTDSGSFNVRLIVSSVIMAATSALTKQAGIFVLLILPLLIYLTWIRKSATPPPGKKEIKQVILAFCISALVVLSWYLLKWIQINAGIDSSNITYVTKDIYHGAGLIKRAEDAFVVLGKYRFLLWALVPAVFFMKRPYRWFGIFIVIPFFIIWIFFFSYEPRNLALIFPFWGMLIGLFVEQLFEYGVRLAAFLKVQKIPAVSLSLILILILVALGIRYPLPKLVQNQEEKQWQIFNPQLDSDIRKLVEKTGTNIKILTNYPVDYLPHLQGVGVSYWYDNVSDYQSALKNPEIGYLLIPQNIDPGVETDIQNGLQTGKLKELFSSDGAYAYRMIEVVH